MHPLCLAHLTLATLAPGALQDASEGAPPPPSWDTLAEHFTAAERGGFSGSVLVVRDGEVVLDAGYGLAQRAAGVRCTPETVYAIGSTPIDFTRAAVLLLAERGALALEEPLAFFLDDVPDDKRAITVAQLMSGGSGLPDFHDVPSDRDPDHFYIDRDEALRRILGLPLLFRPGTAEQHSHAAWVLLAALVEVRSESSYPEFVRAELLEPAGMTSTGFFGEEIPESRMAIGYGDRTTGAVNAPPYWGPTSWLVMGSGGMVSTTHDLARWQQALRAGKLLAPESLARYWSPPGAVLNGGDMWGFEIIYTEGPGTYLFVVSNSVDGERRATFEAVARPVVELTLRAARTDYTLGVGLEFDPQTGTATIAEVSPGGAARRAGLRVGDVLVSANGAPFAGRPPMELLEPLLRSPQPIALEVLRDGQALRVSVRPAPR